jgi:2-haloacid dehalogenase
MTLHGIRYRESDGDKIIAAVSTFGPFPDVPDALRELKRTHNLVIVTNSDDALMAENVKNIGVEFDQVITAEQAHAYKPSREMFDHAWRSVGVPLDRITHVAQGWEYDIMPTLDYGMRRVWINRQGQPGSESFQPYDELPDLSELPALLGS